MSDGVRECAAEALDDVHDAFVVVRCVQLRSGDDQLVDPVPVQIAGGEGGPGATIAVLAVYAMLAFSSQPPGPSSAVLPTTVA